MPLPFHSQKTWNKKRAKWHLKKAERKFVEGLARKGSCTLIKKPRSALLNF